MTTATAASVSPSRLAALRADVEWVLFVGAATALWLTLVDATPLGYWMRSLFVTELGALRVAVKYAILTWVDCLPAIVLASASRRRLDRVSLLGFVAAAAVVAQGGLGIHVGFAAAWLVAVIVRRDPRGLPIFVPVAVCIGLMLFDLIVYWAIFSTGIGGSGRPPVYFTIPADPLVVLRNLPYGFGYGVMAGWGMLLLEGPRHSAK